MRVRTVALTLAMSLVAVALNIQGAAAFSWWGFRAIYGVGDWGNSPQYYWIDSSASGQTSRVNTGMSQWVNTTSYVGVGNPVVYYNTSVKSKSRMDFYQESTVQSSYCAVTEFYIDTTRIVPRGYAPDRNWWWSKIVIARPALFDSSSCPNRQGIVAHEMGHGFGLAHNTYSSTLMYSGIAGTSVTRAQLDDVNGVRYIY